MRTHKFSQPLHNVARVILTRPLRLIYGCEVINAANLPAQGPVILACNHSSNADPLLIGVGYSRPIRWMAKAELWKFYGPGWLIEILGAFPVKRGVSDRDAIRRAYDLLEQGWVVGMYPEGTRYRDGVLGEAQPGVGMMALHSGVPVVPLRVRGSEQVVRGGRPHRPHVTMTVGKPVDLVIDGMSKGRAYKEASRRIMEAIAAL